MSKQRHNVFTITYDPRKGIPSGLLGNGVVPQQAALAVGMLVRDAQTEVRS